jgi:hypothetical protein
MTHHTFDRDNGERAPVPAGTGHALPVQIADPAVSKAKFDWELAHFLQSESVQRRRGVLVVRAAFPHVLLAFAVPGRTPNAILFGALINYTDYDHRAPSIELIDPFTEQPYHVNELPPALMRRVVALRGTGGHTVLAPLVWRRDGAALAVCVPGSRHYYEHPAVGRHVWAAARVRDAGGLTSLVDQLRTYATDAVGEGIAAALRVPATPEPRPL